MLILQGRKYVEGMQNGGAWKDIATDQPIESLKQKQLDYQINAPWMDTRIINTKQDA